MEIINWIKEESKGSFNRPNLVAYALLEIMANHDPSKRVDEVFKPFDPEALQVELKINGVDVSFKFALDLIQKHIETFEDTIRKAIITDAGQALDQELAHAIENLPYEEWEKIAEKNWPGAYQGGLGDCQVEWVEKGTAFSVNEYDGYESIEFADRKSWSVA